MRVWITHLGHLELLSCDKYFKLQVYPIVIIWGSLDLKIFIDLKVNNVIVIIVPNSPSQ